MAVVVTDVGQTIPPRRLAGLGAEPNYIGWGTGAGTAGTSDTTLSSEVALDLVTSTGSRTLGTSSQVTTTLTNDTYQVTGTLTASAPGTVTTAGLWDNASIGSGTLYVAGNFAGVTLASGDAIAFTIKVKFS